MKLQALLSAAFMALSITALPVEIHLSQKGHKSNGTFYRWGNGTEPWFQHRKNQTLPGHHRHHGHSATTTVATTTISFATATPDAEHDKSEFPLLPHKRHHSNGTLYRWGNGTEPWFKHRENHTVTDKPHHHPHLGNHTFHGHVASVTTISPVLATAKAKIMEHEKRGLPSFSHKGHHSNSALYRWGNGTEPWFQHRKNNTVIDKTHHHPVLGNHSFHGHVVSVTTISPTITTPGNHCFPLHGNPSFPLQQNFTHPLHMNHTGNTTHIGFKHQNHTQHSTFKLISRVVDHPVPMLNQPIPLEVNGNGLAIPILP